MNLHPSQAHVAHLPRAANLAQPTRLAPIAGRARASSPSPRRQALIAGLIRRLHCPTGQKKLGSKPGSVTWRNFRALGTRKIWEAQTILSRGVDIMKAESDRYSISRANGLNCGGGLGRHHYCAAAQSIDEAVDGMVSLLRLRRLVVGAAARGCLAAGAAHRRGSPQSRRRPPSTACLARVARFLRMRG